MDNGHRLYNKGVNGKKNAKILKKMLIKCTEIGCFKERFFFSLKALEI